MVKTALAASLLVLIAIPALAQDDYPRIQMGFGYANLALPVTSAADNRHNSGFMTQMDYNFSRNVGFDYYMGYYGLGNGSQLFANLFGGKLMLQGDKLAPYAIAAIGMANSGVSSYYYYGGGNSLAARFGGGLDYKFGDMFAWRIEATKFTVHNSQGNISQAGAFGVPPVGIAGGPSWIGNLNIATGIVFTLMQ